LSRLVAARLIAERREHVAHRHETAAPQCGSSMNCELRTMNRLNLKHAAAAALIGLAYTGVASPAWAGIDDYEFKLVQTEVKKGDTAIVAVRLVDKRSGKAVPDAVIIAKRVDMAPAGMAEMTEPIEQLPSAEPGVYRFKAALVMAGGWRLSLAAKVQGETGTVENKLDFKAVP
jgi:hypothetical protein